MTDIILPPEKTKIGEDKVSVTINQNRNIIEDPKPIRGFVSVEIRRKDGTVEVLCHNKENLLTDAGRDDFHDGLYTNASSTQEPFNFIALTSNAVAPDAGDTALAGEITSGGLARVQAASRVHTGSTNTSTLIQTFSATAQHPNVQKAGVFDIIGPPVAGTLGHTSIFTSASLEIGDDIVITWVFTVG